MDNLQKCVENYLKYCQVQKRLDEKTLRTYQTDLSQFCEYARPTDILEITPELLENFFGDLHQKYKPKTVKRKIASLKYLFHYFEYKDLIVLNPFNKIQIKFRDPVLLPKTIPLYNVEAFLSTIYKQASSAKTDYQRRNALRDVAVIELLFAAEMQMM